MKFLKKRGTEFTFQIAPLNDSVVIQSTNLGPFDNRPRLSKEIVMALPTFSISASAISFYSTTITTYIVCMKFTIVP